MDVPASLLNQPIPCSCGREHFVPIEKVAVGDGILSQITDYLESKGFQKALIVADDNTYEVFGESVFEALQGAGIELEKVILNAHHLLPDEHATEKVQSTIREFSGSQVVIAVGSGVINDVSRYASYLEGLPYIVVATAPSMDGYASGIAAMQFAGVKTTLPAQSPIAIFADTRVLAEAPFELLQSGFGDLVGKVISLCDWKLSNALYGEYFCQPSYELVSAPLEYCVNHADDLKNRDEQAAENLFVGLIQSGIAMAMVGNSRPCSGAEHHCSHFWDMLAFLNERDHASHGIQVGYATRWMMEFYGLFGKLPEVKPPVTPELTEAWESEVEHFYGDGAKTVLEAQRAKREWLLERNPSVVEPDIAFLRQALQPELSMFPKVREALDTMDLPIDMGILGLNEAMMVQTFQHAWELRNRFTIFDFLRGQQRLDETITEVMAIASHGRP